MASIRELSQQQFADSSSIDGNRIDQVMEDMWQAFNNLEPRWIEYLWVMQNFVQGYIPADARQLAAVQGELPFLPIWNGNGWLQGTPDNGPFNEWRLKGTEIPGVDPSLGGSTSIWEQDQFAWTTAHWFENPVILQSYCWVLQTAGLAYPNNFQYGSAPPPGRSNTEPVNDIIIEITVDNPYSLEERDQTAVEVHKLRFHAAAQAMTPIGGGAAYSDDARPFSPAVNPPASNPPDGLVIDLGDLNVPIPRRSRVRTSIVIPQYSYANQAGWNNNRVTRRQWYSNTFTVLEALQ